MSDLIYILLLSKVESVHLAHERLQQPTAHVATTARLGNLLPRQLQRRLIKGLNKVFSKRIQCLLVDLPRFGLVERLKHPVFLAVTRFVLDIFAAKLGWLN